MIIHRDSDIGTQSKHLNGSSQVLSCSMTILVHEAVDTTADDILGIQMLLYTYFLRLTFKIFPQNLFKNIKYTFLNSNFINIYKFKVLLNKFFGKQISTKLLLKLLIS